MYYGVQRREAGKVDHTSGNNVNNGDSIILQISDLLRQKTQRVSNDLKFVVVPSVQRSTEESFGAGTESPFVQVTAIPPAAPQLVGLRSGRTGGAHHTQRRTYLRCRY